MEVPPGKPGLTLGATRDFLLPFTALLCLSLYYAAHLPVVLVCALGACLLLLYALAPQWAARSVLSFDRDAVRMLAAGKADALLLRYRTATGMRWFAPRAISAERRAMVLAETGRMPAARAAYKAALDEYGPAAPLRVMLGYAHTSFGLGDDLAAVPIYRKLLASAGPLPGVERNLAHALVRLGQDLPDALPMLVRAEHEAHDPARALELKLVRALAHAKLGQPEQAQALLLEAEPAEGPSADGLREALRDTLAPLTPATRSTSAATSS